MRKIKKTLFLIKSKIKGFIISILRFTLRLQRLFVRLIFVNPKLGGFLYKKLKDQPNVYKYYRLFKQYVSFLDRHSFVIDNSQRPEDSTVFSVEQDALYNSILQSMLKKMDVSLDVLKVEQLRTTDYLSWDKNDDVDQNIKCIFYAYLRRLPSDEDMRFYGYVCKRRKNYMPAILAIKNSVEFSNVGFIKVIL